MVDPMGHLEWIPPMALATVTSAFLTCVSSRSKYNKGSKGAVPDQPVVNLSSETAADTAIEQQGGSLGPDVVVSPPIQPPRVRIHRRVHYHAIPRTPIPCLAYKFGAPDGIDRRDVEDIFEPRDQSYGETASYGDTFVLPAPSTESSETD